MNAKPDFSGRWIYEEPPVLAIAPAGPQQVTIAPAAPANELQVTQNADVILVGHSSRPGGLPHEGAHFFGSSGTNTAGISYKSSVTWMAGELVIESTMDLLVADGSRNVTHSIERWRMTDQGQLEIHVVDEQSGKETVSEILSYRRAGGAGAAR
jgi:hypothetical protein